MRRIIAMVVMTVAVVLLPVVPAHAAAAQVCRNGVCDGQDPATVPAGSDRVLQTTQRWFRRIELHVSYANGGMAWADLKNGQAGDEVWLDRQISGREMEHQLGYTTVPAGRGSWRTLMYWINDPASAGQLRACGKAGDRPEISCTDFLPACAATWCDGVDPQGFAERYGPNAWVWYRNVQLHVRTDDGMAWASIEHGSAGDEVWIDRSFDGGSTWQPKLGDTFIASCQAGQDCGWRGWMYTFNDGVTGRTGQLRACGKAGDRATVGCTPWTRPSDRIPSIPHAAAVDLLWQGYNPGTHQWDERGQWLSGNALTAAIDAMIRTGDRGHENMIATIFNAWPMGYPEANGFYDDYAWWALAWVRAYDLTGVPAYRRKAEDIAQLIGASWNDDCGGGVKWNAGQRVKNTITNALYLQLAAALHNRGAGGGTWLTQAQNTWKWFHHGGGKVLLGDSGLVKDTLNVTDAGCTVNDQRTWTYNQGVVIGGLAELYRATGNAEYLSDATRVANAATTDSLMLSSGVLHYGPEEEGDGLWGDVKLRLPADGVAFKGIFVRNLRLLYDVSPNRAWADFLTRQSKSIVDLDRAGWAEFGFHWTGQIRLSFHDDATGEGSYITFATQMSAVDAFNASAGL
jgi:predicted alpha-1,6-mannanase (GH76 family)